ncbi:AbrB family transcriptional regulator [Paralimibaculum aggregatum]|uniref:AbrB family transcriptional regulator n=1 Tax=Paralimibaculum aggregatum TaxID=3036245 RepID=A0ABQ6LHD7_9RHOB|nr:AbrB family transcriptional regulator [Limibaculum sp. NKW23]GMG81534.1 AbrB family transcriptional regulator [Limibaculum sp. NKW23]
MPNTAGFLSRHRWRAFTFAAAGLGTYLFSALGLPLPFLFGPMAACLLSALLGAPLAEFGQVSVGARTVLGVAVGASITPALFAQLPTMAGSIALVPLFIVLIALIGVPFFRHVWKFDPATAYYAAMPGGLQDMVIFGTEAGGNPRALSLIHATRVLIIVTVAPVLLTQFYGVSLANPIGAPAAEIPLHEIGLMALAALVGWKLGERVGLFGAAILGPLIVAAAMSLAGLIHMRPPREAILAAQFLIGAGIGVQFVGVTLGELRRVVMAGVAFVSLLALLAAGFSQVVMGLGLGNPVEAFLAFAPGGQAEMTVLAIVTGADLGFVVTHHLVRLIIVITGAPLAAALLSRARPPD